MNEDYFLSAWKHKIGFADQIVSVQTKAVAQRVHQSSNDPFRSSISPPDAAEPGGGPVRCIAPMSHVALSGLYEFHVATHRKKSGI